MKPSLGDRIREERDKIQTATDTAMEDACVESRTYTDEQILEVKAWVEDRIAQLATDNSLINNP